MATQNTDSQILRNIPKDWSSSHLRWKAKIYSGGTPKREVEEYWEDGTIPWLSSGEVNQDLVTHPSTYITLEAFKSSSAKWVPKEALIIALAGQGKTKGMVAQLGIETTTNQSLAAIVPRGVESRYLYYWLKMNYKTLRGLAGDGLRDGLNLEMLGSFPIPIPPIKLQRSIVKSLDNKTIQIDALIARKKCQIELLKEKRSALITQAVTKGLDPSVKMKDSGVEWLSEIPEHWDHQALKRVASLVGRIGFRGYSTDDIVDEGEGAITLSPRNMVQGKLSLDDCTYVSWEKYNESPEIQIFINDILLVKTGSTYGKVAYVGIAPMEMTVNPQIMVLKEIKANPRYLYYAVTSRPFHGLLRLLNTGSTIPTMTQEGVGRIHVPMPGRDEQDGIVEYLDSHSEKIDVLIERITKSISLLDEHRSSLISEAVTGKLPIGETS